MAGESVPLNYLPILLFIGIAIAFGAISLLAGWFGRPSRPYRAKLTPYESGSPLFSDARIQFPMRYYIIAMLFVIFDIEIIFMIPWAVRFQSLGLLGLIEMLVFLGILLVGFWYAWKKGRSNGTRMDGKPGRLLCLLNAHNGIRPGHPFQSIRRERGE